MIRVHSFFLCSKYSRFEKNWKTIFFPIFFSTRFLKVCWGTVISTVILTMISTKFWKEKTVSEFFWNYFDFPKKSITWLIFSFHFSFRSFEKLNEKCASKKLKNRFLIDDNTITNWYGKFQKRKYSYSNPNEIFSVTVVPILVFKV